MLILNIFPNYISCHFIPNRTNKISIAPQFPAPKTLLYFWKFLKNYFRRYTLYSLHYRRRSILRWYRQKQMYMFFHYFHRINLKFILLCYLLKYFLQSIRYFSLKGSLSIFWYPYKMILQVIYTVFTSSQWAHAHIVQKSILTSSGCPFHPSSKATGYSRTVFIMTIRQSRASILFSFPYPQMKKYGVWCRGRRMGCGLLLL